MEVHHYLTLFSAFNLKKLPYNCRLQGNSQYFSCFFDFFRLNYCTVQKKHLSLHRI